MKLFQVIILIIIFLMESCHEKGIVERKELKYELTDYDSEIIRKSQFDALVYQFYLSGEESMFISLNFKSLDNTYKDYHELLIRTKRKNKIIINHLQIYPMGFGGVYQYNELGLLDSMFIGTCELRGYKFKYFRKRDSIVRIDRQFNSFTSEDTSTKFSGKKIFILNDDTLIKTYTYSDTTLVEECDFFYQFGNLKDKITIYHKVPRLRVFRDIEFLNQDKFQYLRKAGITSHYFNKNNQLERIEKYNPGHLIVTKFMNGKINEILSYSNTDSTFETIKVKIEKK